MTTDDDYWLRYRKADLAAQIAAEEALGRNTGLLYAARRMVAHLEGRKSDTVRQAPTYCVRCGRSSLVAVINPKNGVCTRCSTVAATTKKKDDLRADHDLLRNFVHRQNVVVSTRLDTTDECVDILRETVEKLADNQEKLFHLIKLTQDTDLTQNRLLARCDDRLVKLEDRLDPPPSDESLTDRIARQDDEPHGIGLDGRCADCDAPEADTWLSNQERIDLIGRWMHPGLWSALDGRREAILKILGGQHVEPPLAGGGVRER